MGYGESRKTATNNYRAKYDMIQVRVEQGERSKIIDHAKKQGESMNAFINRAIKETMKRDNESKCSNESNTV